MAAIAFVTGLAQETNVFGPMPTGLDSFSGRYVLDGRRHDDAPPFPESLVTIGRRHCADGSLSALIEGPMAGAHPSGRVTREAYERFRTLILEELERAMPVDIVAVHLHGAMIADGYDDCEGDLLTHMRAIAGPDCALGAMLDPHAHVSAAMVGAADILIAYKEYPHIDFRERAEEVWRLLLATAAGHVRPVTRLWDSGTIGIFHSSRPEVRALIGDMQALEASGEALSVSLIHSFPWGDCADFGTRALAICDGDAERADQIAGRIALAARAIACASPPTNGNGIGAVLDRITAAGPTDRPYVLADSADNPGGGAAGDSTFVLGELIRRGVREACLGPLWDPQAVAIAFQAGLGARLPLRIGGKTGPLSGPPIDVDATIVGLCPAATQLFAGEAFPLGRAAAINAEGIDIVLVTERDQARGPDLFTTLGIDVTAKQIVVVKSSQHFRDGFEPLAREIIYLDGPGSLQTDLAGYPYRRIVRPRWPIDAEAPLPFPIALGR
ncbi:MAG: M81 family metallopeptidase [Pseudomonadota bacterium]